VSSIRATIVVATSTLVAAFAACGGETATGGGPLASDAGSTLDATTPGDAGADAAVDPYAALCTGAATPPDKIECTGLYTDVAAKVIAPGVREFAPAVPLWADFAGKGRWIYLGLGLWRQLPAGTDGAYQLLANLISLGRTRK